MSRVAPPRKSTVASHVQPRKYYAKHIGYTAIRVRPVKLLSGCFSKVRFMRCERTLSFSHGVVAVAALFVQTSRPFFRKLLLGHWEVTVCWTFALFVYVGRILLVALWAFFQVVCSSDELSSL